MRLFTFLLLAIAVCHTAFGNWESTIHGTPAPGSIAADSAGQTILIGYPSAGIWITHDGGQSWLQLHDEIAPSEYIQANPDRMEIMDSDGDTLIMTCLTRYPRHDLNNFHSFDGGATWSSYDLMPWWPDSIGTVSAGGHPVRILHDRIYYSRQDGFGISHDSGSSWEIINVEPYQRGIQGMFFEIARPDTIYLYGSWGPNNGDIGPEVGGIIASYNGGYEWQRITPMEQLTDITGRMKNMTRGDGNWLYAITYWSYLDPHPPFLKSEDNGQNWNWIYPQGLPPHIYLRDLMAVPERPGRLIAGANSDDGVWESDDRGETWHRLLRGLPEDPSSVGTFYRNQRSGHLYLGLYGQGIFHSTDYGDSWQELPGPEVGELTNTLHGLLIGEPGVIHTLYEGYPYVAQDGSVVFNYVEPLDLLPDHSHSAYGAGYAGNTTVLYRVRRDYTQFMEEFCLQLSDNGSDNWTTSNPQNYWPHTSPWDVMTVVADTGTAIVAGDREAESVLVSWDMGNSWNSTPAPTQFDHIQHVDGNLYITSSFGAATYDIYESSDLGQTWTPLEFPNIADLIFASPVEHLSLDDTLYVCESEQLWAYSRENGWQQRGLIDNEFYLATQINWDIVTGPIDTLIVAGDFRMQRLFTSYDMGWTWEEQPLEMPGDYAGEACLAVRYDQWRDRLWVDSGMGLMYLNDPTSHVGEDVWAFQPAQYVTMSSYPNPFNSTATVHYELTVPGDVRVEVFDLLGRRVAKLVDGLRTPGPHNATFDASALASGTYFLHLSTGEQTINRRITLVK